MSRNSPPKFSAPHSLCGNRFEGGSEFRLRVDQSPQNCLPTAAVVCAWRRQISERAHLYSPRGGAIPFAPSPTPPTRRRQAGRDAHSLSILQFKHAFLPLSQVGWQAGTCVGLWISLPLLVYLASFFPGVVVVVFAIAIAIRHRWFLYIRAELMVWPLFPFLFLLSLSLSLSFAYIYGRNAPTIMSTLITIKKDPLHSAVSRDKAVSPHLEISCVTSVQVPFHCIGFNRPQIGDER